MNVIKHPDIRPEQEAGLTPILEKGEFLYLIAPYNRTKLFGKSEWFGLAVILVLELVFAISAVSMMKDMIGKNRVFDMFIYLFFGVMLCFILFTTILFPWMKMRATRKMTIGLTDRRIIVFFKRKAQYHPLKGIVAIRYETDGTRAGSLGLIFPGGQKGETENTTDWRAVIKSRGIWTDQFGLIGEIERLVRHYCVATDPFEPEASFEPEPFFREWLDPDERVIWTARPVSSKKTPPAYAVTNKRIVIIEPLSDGKTRVTSYLPDRVDVLEKVIRSGGSGDLVLGRDEYGRPQGLLRVPDLKAADAAILELQRHWGKRENGASPSS